MANIDLGSFEQIIDYVFKNKKYAIWALSHPSAKSKNKQFERLEFLGDRVLGLAIATLLLKTFETENEGNLAKRQAYLVSRESCEQVATMIYLNQFVLSVVDGSVKSNRASVLADAVEALLGAIYLDGGIDGCHQFVRRFWQPLLDQSKTPPKDAKSTLQECCQKRGKAAPHYVLLSQTGPAHQPLLTYEVILEGYPNFQGVGYNRKTAEQSAALLALEYLKNKNIF